MHQTVDQSLHMQPENGDDVEALCTLHAAGCTYCNKQCKVNIKISLLLTPPHTYIISGHRQIPIAA